MQLHSWCNGVESILNFCFYEKQHLVNTVLCKKTTLIIIKTICSEICLPNEARLDDLQNFAQQKVKY